MYPSWVGYPFREVVPSLIQACPMPFREFMIHPVVVTGSFFLGGGLTTLDHACYTSDKPLYANLPATRVPGGP